MQSGKLTALAVGSETRLAEFPDLPAAAETIPNFRSAGWLAMMAPAEAPAAVVRKVSADLKTVLDNPEVRSKLAALGSYARPMSPQVNELHPAEQRTRVRCSRSWPATVTGLGGASAINQCVARRPAAMALLLSLLK
jgi:hypothetical protein